MSYQGFLAYGLSMVAAMQQRNEEKLREIEEEWVRSMEYPRKKKKKVRKHLQLEYSIFSYAKNMFEL